jgi:hypothetical protein
MEHFFNDNPDLVKVSQEASYEMEDAFSMVNRLSLYSRQMSISCTYWPMKRLQDWKA